jgi:hypothetical protein
MNAPAMALRRLNTGWNAIRHKPPVQEPQGGDASADLTR